MFAKVIVDIAVSEVDKIFEYSYFGDEVKLGSRVLVPFGNKNIEGIVIDCSKTSDYDANKIKPVFCAIDNGPVLTEEMIELMKYMQKTCYTSRASILRLFLPSEMRKGRVKEKFVNYVYLSEDVNVDEVIASLKKTATKQRDALLFLSENGESLLSQVNGLFGQSAVKSIIEKGYIKVVSKQDVRSPYKDLELNKKDITLTLKQQSAVDSILKTDKQITLLYGVTGSGKTEVYLNLISKTIESGKSAIMLVPEIALTPQMLKQLRARFGDNAAILHSGLSAGERFDEWWRLKSGEAKIAIGARSAVFAPVDNVGLIIIDEEHDGSYTSETTPRYNTIDVAKFRATFNHAKIVVGSATPSLETYLLAKNGQYNLATLPDRINKKPLPEVIITDMRGEVRRGNATPFSGVLKNELEKCLKDGKQAIIFLNQRGFSKSVICTECGHVIKCHDCDVSLTYHMEEGSLLCHYCGAKYKMVDACPECGSRFLRYGGTGTERVVSELKKLYPSARILRMDRDTTQTKEGHFKILNAFSYHEADILVGTQMIAKGHDFPNVTLVGILDADMSLHFSDYRCGERTFQLLTQVSGRSGRADQAGKVVLQTYSPENEILKRAIKYDYEGFFDNEISIRKATGFPPFTDIIRVLISGEDEEKTVEKTKTVYEQINVVYNANREFFKFFGCMKSPLKKLQKKYRFQVLMRIDKDCGELLDKVYEIVNRENTRQFSVSLEINPNNLA